MKALYTIIGLFVGLVLGIFIPKPIPQENRNIQEMGYIMSSMSNSLDGKSGDEFDREFLKQMIIHHQGAIDMASQVLVRSSREELRSVAQDIIVTQDKEIELMKKWQIEWFTAQ